MERILFPIVAPMVLWGTSLRGKRIIVRTDNAAAVFIVNGQTSKCPEIMQLLSCFVLQFLKNKVAFSVRHISGCENNVTDACPPPFRWNAFDVYSTTGRAKRTSGFRVSLEPI